jgi:acetoin:2,6-dichlorophenolindophenol oxidoreductase subunit alpha
VFTGDGALGEGVIYETLNMAALWEVPLLVVVENNGYSQSTPIAMNFAGDIETRFAGFGVATSRIESTDVLEVHEEAAEAVADVRRSGAPRGLIIDTYRLCHHSKSDDNRPEEEVAARWAFEPLEVHGGRLEPGERERVDLEVEDGLSEVVAHARALR